MQSILKTVKLCICAALMAVIFPMSVYAGSDEGMVEVTGSGSFTLEEIVKEEPDILEQVQATAAEAEDEYMTMTVEIKGNQVLYVTTFKDALYATMTESEVQELAQDLEKGMSGATSEFSSLAEAVDDAMGVPRGTVSMVIRFCDSDGRILAETDFRAE